jgi:Protein of unknown function (DUF3455)
MRILSAVLALGLAGAAWASPLPEAFGVGGRTILLSVHAEGAQVYECKASPSGGFAWSFREPVATLIKDGKTIGRHFAGPSWQVGEELLKGKPAASAQAPGPGDIPWLKLDVAGHQGAGPLEAASLILRVDTHGGAFSGACDTAGALHAAPYSAEYVFLR